MTFDQDDLRVLRGARNAVRFHIYNCCLVACLAILSFGFAFWRIRAASLDAMTDALFGYTQAFVIGTGVGLAALFWRTLDNRNNELLLRLANAVLDDAEGTGAPLPRN